MCGDYSVWGKIGWYGLKALGFIVVSFVFSVIFWAVGKHMMHGTCKEHMKKHKKK
ncbi:hypothetical protein ACFL0V_04290 [Nanoarchaeota archaeon]